MPDNYVANTSFNVLDASPAAVGIEQTGLLDLNGNTQGFGLSNSQWAIIMEVGGDIQIGTDSSSGLTGGQLNLNGNVMAE